MPRAVVLDIEGTTSSAAYVRDHLFPYSAQRIPQWVTRTGPDVAALVEEARLAAGLPAGDPDAVAAALCAWIRQDAKIPALKSLQGMIWAEGYALGELRSHVYDDVPPALAEWTRAGLTVHIYSSGSAQAQRNWFRHCAQGDLSRYLSEYFDTRNAGPKREVTSYVNIARTLKIPAVDLLFLSDTPAELDAAANAGWQTVGVHRPEDEQADFGAHREISGFEQVTPVPDAGARCAR